jgi:hypothetical protein
MSKVARTSLIFLSAKINSFHCVFGKKKGATGTWTWMTTKAGRQGSDLIRPYEAITSQ